MTDLDASFVTTTGLWCAIATHPPVHRHPAFCNNPEDFFPYCRYPTVASCAIRRYLVAPSRYLTIGAPGNNAGSRPPLQISNGLHLAGCGARGVFLQQMAPRHQDLRRVSREGESRPSSGSMATALLRRFRSPRTMDEYNAMAIRRSALAHERLRMPAKIYILQ